MVQDAPALAQEGAREAPGSTRRAPAVPATTLPPVLTVDEAAAFLRLNRKTLYDAVRAGELPGVVRVGRSIRIGRDALLGWLKGNGGPALGDDR
jgi:excisionase family DNA binding protein